MLRQLVTERFQLKSHYEDRPVTAYSLLANNPKMAKADPANRTGFREGPAPGQRDQRNQIINRMVTVRTCRCRSLQKICGASPAATFACRSRTRRGWTGRTISRSRSRRLVLLNARGGGPGGDASAGASDPTGALSLFDAVERQLGLKLEMRKRPMKVLVIDSIQEKPLD
jgi:uncharacterized protein (TIGR03435 family)